MNDDIKEHLAKGDDSKSFDELLDKGIKNKEAGRLQEALHCYKDALDHASGEEQELETWNLILHVHTDRMLATLQTIAEKQRQHVRMLNWNKGSNMGIEENTGYNRPSNDELLK